MITLEIMVLDDNFVAQTVVDSFESLIWTERYYEYGDFELYVPVDPRYILWMRDGYYLWMRDSDKVMIIESVQVQSDTESGSHVIVKGKSLESLLARRIVWVQTNLDGNLQNGIEKLLKENIITPSISSRKISNFVFEKSTDTAITSLTVDAQYTGDNLYEVISNLCKLNNIGFKITLSDDHKFIFKLYAGADRSYKQIKNPYVIFSPNFENLINSDYTETIENYKTVTLVAGEGEGTARKTTTVAVKDGEGSGIRRRELYTDARDISSEKDDGTKLTDSEYTKKLQQRGSENLAEYGVEIEFQGEVDSFRMFVYGRDFFMGDIVQIRNEWNIEARSRVLEVIRSQDKSGLSIFPTFAFVEE